MKISIALASYNGSNFLEEQLNSFLKQTKLPDELVITDDCSTDNTEDIILEFAKTAPFKVIYSRNKENLGYCKNFNEAIMKTSGDLVFLSDQDDIWFPNKIEYILQVAKENPDTLLIMNDTELTDSSLNKTSLTKIGQIESAGLPITSFIMGCCCAIRRDLLDICMPIDPEYKAHDNWLVTFGYGLDSVIVERKVLQLYRRHESNVSQFIVNRTEKITRFKFITNELKNLFNKNRKNNFKNSGAQLLFIDKAIDKAIDRAYEKPNIFLKLEIFKKNFHKSLVSYNYRSFIREHGLIIRTILVLNSYRKGRYRSKNGLISMLRDIIN